MTLVCKCYAVVLYIIIYKLGEHKTNVSQLPNKAKPVTKHDQTSHTVTFSWSLIVLEYAAIENVSLD